MKHAAIHITFAACTALGVASIATSARAQDATTVTTCSLMATVAQGADTMRQSGISQPDAAALLGAVIGGALSNEPSIPLHARQRLASSLGDWGSVALSIVYAQPIQPTPTLRELSPYATRDVVFGLCMDGELL